MPGVVIGKGAEVYNAILGPDTQIKDGEIINKDSNEVVLLDYERNLK